MIAEFIPAWTADAIHFRTEKEILCEHHDQKFSPHRAHLLLSIMALFPLPLRPGTTIHFHMWVLVCTHPFGGLDTSLKPTQ